MCYYQVRLSVWYVYFLHFSSTFISRYNLFVKDNHRSSLRRNVYVAQRLLLVGLCVHCIIHVNKYQINFYYVLFLMLYNNETEYFFFTENWFCFVINIFAERHAKNVYFLVCVFRIIGKNVCYNNCISLRRERA